MTQTHGHRFTRRHLLTTAAAATATGSALIATHLARPPSAVARAAAGAFAPRSLPFASASAKLDEVLQTGIDRGLAGLALRVERGGEVMFDGAIGFASRERATPLAPTDRLRIASIAKTFTAVLVLQLVDDGILRLDDTVARWLNDPVVGRIPHVDQITIHQLLTHTSGVYDYFDDDSPFWVDAYFGEGVDWARVWTPHELLAYVDGAKHAPYFAPGEGSHYSNVGYILLGLILEQATGQRYAEQLQTRILDPLELADTYFAATEPVPGVVPDAYHLIEGELVNVSTIHLSAMGSAAGIITTPRDLARFGGALFDGELLDPPTQHAMFTFNPSDHPTFETGLGVMRWQIASGALVGHSGDGPGCAARMYRPVDTDFTLVLIVNSGGDEATVDDVFSQVVEAVRQVDAVGG